MRPGDDGRAFGYGAGRVGEDVPDEQFHEGFLPYAFSVLDDTVVSILQFDDDFVERCVARVDGRFDAATLAAAPDLDRTWTITELVADAVASIERYLAATPES
jgi:hypothetical protein